MAGTRMSRDLPGAVLPKAHTHMAKVSVPWGVWCSLKHT